MARKAKAQAPGVHMTGGGKTAIATTMTNAVGRKGRKSARKMTGR